MHIAILSFASAVLFGAFLELLLRWFDVADPPTFRVDSRCGYVMHSNQSVATRGRRFRINNLGLRGEDVPMPKPAERRLVFLGDSVTYGGGSITEQDLFVNRIAKGLSTEERGQVRAVNVSAPGWGIRNIAAYIEVNGLFGADAVVWIAPSIDFRRPKMSLEDIGYPAVRPRSRLLYAARSWLLARSAVHRMRHRHARERGARSGADELNANLAAFDATLRTLAPAVPWLVVILPGEAGYGSLSTDVLQFKAIADSHHVVFVDLLSTFQEHSGHSLFQDGVHLTVGGHALVARELIPVIDSCWKAAPLSSCPCSHARPRRSTTS